VNRPTTVAPSTPGQHPGPEVLAAYIDGELPREERARIVDHLAACADCYEAFAETVHFLDEEEAAAAGGSEDSGEGGGGKVIVHPRARWARRAAVVVPTTIAAMLMFLVGPRVADLLLPSGPLPARDLVARLGAADDLGSRLGKGWENPLPRYRGRGGEGTSGTDDLAVFRSGVLALDLAVALRTDDGARARELAADLAGQLGGVMLAEGPAERYEDLADRLENEPARGLAAAAADADAELAELFAGPSSPYALGQWAEAGRLAAVAGEPGFFADRRVRRFGARLDAEVLPAVLAAEVKPIQELLKRRGAPDFEVLKDRFTALVRAGGPG
jgi:Putative zinc-finger